MGILAPFLVVVAFAQQTATITGTVRQDSTLVPIPDARVEVVELARTAVTDPRGRFLLTGLPEGRWTVRAGTIGYRTDTLAVVLAGARPISVEFRLQRQPVALGELNVEVLRLPSVGPARVKLDMETLAEVPALAEVDVLRALDVLPAVASISEYSTALYVRGSTPDQTDVLLDGFPVFNPYHLGGLYAAFDPDVVASVEVTPGAMPAGVGSRIGSVVGVQTRAGGLDRVRTRGTVGLGTLGLAVDGRAPVARLPGSFVASGRRSLRNLTGGGISAEGIVPKTMRTGFDDLFAKWTVPWSSAVLELIAFHSTERVRLSQDVSAARHDWRWGSTLLGASASIPLARRLRLEAKAGSSTFRTELGTWWRDPFLATLQEETISADGHMADRLVSLELIGVAARQRLALGAELRRSNLDYRASHVDDPPPGVWSEFVPRMDDAFHMDVLQLWAEDELRIGPLGVRVGGRVLAGNGLETELQPRAGVRVALARWLALTAGGGRYTQATHSVRVDEAIATSFMAFDLQRPATEPFGAPRATDIVLGAELRRGSASLRVDAYRKRFDRLTLPQLPSNPWHAPVIEPGGFLAGTGESRGLEVLGDYVTSPVGVWLSYAHARTTRTVDGERYTPRFERRHTLDVLTAFSLPDGLRLNVRGIYASGQPTTPKVGVILPPRYDPANGAFYEDRARRWVLLGAHNTIRLPAYRRVDVGGRIKFNRRLLGRSTDLALFAQLVNALNVTNTLYWDPSTRAGVDDDPSWQFPPSLTAGLEWSL